VTELLVWLAIGLCASSGLVGACFARGTALAQRLPAALMVAGSASGLAAGLLTLVVGARRYAHAWPVPGGELSLHVDGLAAMFLIQIFLISALGAVFGLGYWGDDAHGDTARKVRGFFGLVTAGMALLVVAGNAVLFLVGWEIMALAAFFLVSTEDEVPAVRAAGLVYLVATRVGTLCLFAFFTILHSVNGSFDLHAPRLAAGSSVATALFVLALAGFGLKAGAMPLHVWLPGAHANAPSHVSALMSGVLIKMGIYGLVRFLTWFPAPPAWWGIVLLCAGVVSGIVGVLFALAQHDLKRLLAYHSVENIGIILLGLGVGLLGRSYSDDAIFALGVGGALLHVWNHGLFKALLFLGAGSVVHATGTREIDALGGLSKRMPYSSAGFVTGAVAICGLPPLNGFVSELLIYLALARACAHASGSLFAAGAVGAPALAMIGALAVACFVKVIGAVFLGEARTAAAKNAHEGGAVMLVPMAVLAGCCAAIGLAPGLVAPVLDAALATFASAPRLAGVAGVPAVANQLPALSSLVPFGTLSAVAVALALGIGAGLVWARRVRVAAPAAVPTWDCGYAAPTARMQYTSSSFASTLVGMFSDVLRPKGHSPTVRGPFPAAAEFHSHVPEVVLDHAITPSIRLFARGLVWFRWIQRGAIQLYVLYVLAALVLALLVWR
jgi:hydrogenase-4 component B